MNRASLVVEGSKRPHIVLEDGWYLLRENLLLSGRAYRAGTLVEYLHGDWTLKEGQGADKALPLTPDMVCRPFYHGVSLYEVQRATAGAFFARPVLSEVPCERIDPMLVHLVIANGEGRVCVKFGHCFLPLELFNW